MNDLRKKIIDKMTDIYAGDPKRIGHFLKVNAFADLIGEEEDLSAFDRQVLDIASLMHDIGIKTCLEEYGAADGRHQEIVGATEAGEVLDEFGADEELIDRVCFLISRHHSYNDIEDKLLQILVEADFLVNAYEDGLKTAQIESFRDKVFKTDRGKNLLKKTYGLS